jgi:hypothetical protein
MRIQAVFTLLHPEPVEGVEGQNPFGIELTNL